MEEFTRIVCLCSYRQCSVLKESVVRRESCSEIVYLTKSHSPKETQLNDDAIGWSNFFLTSSHYSKQKALDVHLQKHVRRGQSGKEAAEALSFTVIFPPSHDHRPPTQPPSCIILTCISLSSVGLAFRSLL